jgi:hypothetical protein
MNIAVLELYDVYGSKWPIVSSYLDHSSHIHTLVMCFHDSRIVVKIFYRLSYAGVILNQLHCSKKKIRLFENAAAMHFTPIQPFKNCPWPSLYM